MSRFRSRRHGQADPIRVRIGAASLGACTAASAWRETVGFVRTLDGSLLATTEPKPTRAEAELAAHDLAIKRGWVIAFATCKRCGGPDGRFCGYSLAFRCCLPCEVDLRTMAPAARTAEVRRLEGPQPPPTADDLALAEALGLGNGKRGRS